MMKQKRLAAFCMMGILTFGLATGGASVRAADTSTGETEAVETGSASEELTIAFQDQEYAIENNSEKAVEFYVKKSSSDNWGKNLLGTADTDPEEAADETGAVEEPVTEYAYDIRIVGENGSYTYFGLKLSEISDLKLFVTADGATYVTYTDAEKNEVSTEGYAVTVYEEPKVLYATASVHVRSLPSKAGDSVSGIANGNGSLMYGKAEGEDGIWYLVRIKDGYGFTSGAFYSETKPVVQQTWSGSSGSSGGSSRSSSSESQTIINCDGSTSDGSFQEEDIF